MDDSDVIGDCAVIGDSRWAGTYGIAADFIAMEVRYAFARYLQEAKLDVPKLGDIAKLTWHALFSNKTPFAFVCMS